MATTIHTVNRVTIMINGVPIGEANGFNYSVTSGSFVMPELAMRRPKSARHLQRLRRRRWRRRMRDIYGLRWRSKGIMGLTYSGYFVRLPLRLVGHR